LVVGHSCPQGDFSCLSYWDGSLFEKPINECKTNRQLYLSILDNPQQKHDFSSVFV